MGSQSRRIPVKTIRPLAPEASSRTGRIRTMNFRIVHREESSFQSGPIPVSMPGTPEADSHLLPRSLFIETEA